MSIDFLKSIGFRQDPFASTNAADEPLIEEYFVQPPFFPAVVGDPAHPKSNVVFAPRGGGKTAQKIMIEKFSQEKQDFICIAYDKFPVDQLKSPKDASAEFHLSNISRAILLAVLVSLRDSEGGLSRLLPPDRLLIVKLSRSLLGEISSEQSRMRFLR